MAQLPEKVVRLLEGGHMFWVATASRDGVPNVAIKGTGAIADNEHVYFADLFSKKTRANLDENPVVAIGIHDAENHVAVQIKGHVTLADKGSLYDAATKRLAERKAGLPAPNYVVIVEVDSVWDMTGGPNAGNRIA